MVIGDLYPRRRPAAQLSPTGAGLGAAWGTQQPAAPASDKRAREQEFIPVNMFALFIEYLEDMEDIKTIEKIVNDPNTKYSEGMEDLAKECGIDYEAL